MRFDDITAAVQAILLLGGLVMSIVELVRMYRADTAGTRLTFKWIVVYCVYCGCGIGLAVLWLDGPKPERVAIGATMALMAWILYGGVWLTRVVPKSEPLAAWLARVPGPAEATLAAIALVGFLLVYVG